MEMAGTAPRPMHPPPGLFAGMGVGSRRMGAGGGQWGWGENGLELLVVDLAGAVGVGLLDEAVDIDGQLEAAGGRRGKGGSHRPALPSHGSDAQGITYPSTRVRHTLYAAARFIAYPKL